MSTLPIDPRAVALRAWAEGDVAQEAAVNLLIGAAGARLLGGPWVRRHASGGTSRLLKVGTSAAVSGVCCRSLRVSRAVPTESIFGTPFQALSLTYFRRFLRRWGSSAV
jgi:hypothetical protein